MSVVALLFVLVMVVLVIVMVVALILILKPRRPRQGFPVIPNPNPAAPGITPENSGKS